MRNIWTITTKEFRTYFVSPVAYAVLCFLLLITGLIFTLMSTRGGGPVDASLQNLTGTVIFLLILAVPIVTMRLFAEEKATGTLEILMSSPVREYEVVVGKYLGALGFYAVLLAGMLEFPLLIIVLTRTTMSDWPEIYPMVVAYIGWILCGAAFMAIGLLASTMTRSQLVSGVAALAMLLLFWLIAFLGSPSVGTASQVLQQLSFYEHMGEFERGVLPLKSAVYFVSIIIFFLFASVRSIESTRWR